MRLRTAILLAGAALVAVALILWPRLPPVHQDEYLPLLPVSWFTKLPEARTNVLLPYTVPLLGHRIPVRSYPYEGAVKGYLYLASGLRASPGVFRAANLVLVWVLFGLTMLASYRLAGRRMLAPLCCLALLLTDVPLIVVGITDLGRILGVILAVALVLILHGTLAAPAWWKMLPIAAVVFLGEWDRVNFLWFVAAGLAAASVAAALGPTRRSLYGLTLAVAGVVLGLAALDRLIPDYRRALIAGAGRSVGFLDLPRLWSHLRMLLPLLDPFGSYHRYVNVSAPSHAALYDAYQGTFALVFVVVTGVLLAWGLRADRRRAQTPALLLLGVFLPVLLLLILKTAESWAVHHILPIKPFTYLAVGVLVAHVTARRARRVAAAVCGVLAIGSVYVGARGFLDLHHAPLVTGIYDVSWNQVDAWRAAARAPVRTVYALDWGVFYPGAVDSPSHQRWEMREAASPEILRSLDAARQGFDVGLLFRVAGPHRWLLEASDRERRYGLRSEERFNRHPGEAWAFVVANLSRWRDGESMRGTPEGSLVRNGSFADGTVDWRYEKWEAKPGGAMLAVERCDAGGQPRPCVALRHDVPADSRLVQTIELAPRVLYEVSAWARITGATQASKGAHLSLMEYPFTEAAEIRGDSDWRRLRYYVVNLDPLPKSVRLAVRFGTYGSVSTGAAWFADVTVRPAAARDPALPLYEIGGAT